MTVSTYLKSNFTLTNVSEMSDLSDTAKLLDSNYYVRSISISMHNQFTICTTIPKVFISHLYKLSNIPSLICKVKKCIDPQ